ncbi:MAG: SIS domain-containing protein [Nitrososphaerota archaeon]
MMVERRIERYVQGLSQVLGQLPFGQIARFVELLQRIREEGKSIFVFGNGGSAAAASHFACDLGKGTVQEGKARLRVVTLHDIVTFSAYANDRGYEWVFAEPLLSLAQKGDMAVGISTSGNSPNIIKAMEVARKLGLITIGLTGYDGGQLKSLVDLCIIVPSEDMQYIEDAHLSIIHAVFRALL